MKKEMTVTAAGLRPGDEILGLGHTPVGTVLVGSDRPGSVLVPAGRVRVQSSDYRPSKSGWSLNLNERETVRIRRDETLTAGELIAALGELPPDSDVWVAGSGVPQKADRVVVRDRGTRGWYAVVEARGGRVPF